MKAPSYRGYRFLPEIIQHSVWLSLRITLRFRCFYASGDRGVEAYVIHPTSIAVSREQRRAKTDRLDIGLLKRSLLGWLRSEKKRCSMAAVLTLEEEDAKRPTRERQLLSDILAGCCRCHHQHLASLPA